MALRLYRIDALEQDPHRTLKPRSLVRCRLTRIEDGRVLDVRIRCAKNVGDTLALDDTQIQVGLWRP